MLWLVMLCLSPAVTRDRRNNSDEDGPSRLGPLDCGDHDRARDRTDASSMGDNRDPGDLIEGDVGLITRF